MLVDFITNSRKQYSFINVDGISVEDISDDSNLKFYYYGQEKERSLTIRKKMISSFIIKNPLTGIEVPLENTIKVVETYEETDLIITIGILFFKM